MLSSPKIALLNPKVFLPACFLPQSTMKTFVKKRELKSYDFVDFKEHFAGLISFALSIFFPEYYD